MTDWKKNQMIDTRIRLFFYLLDNNPLEENDFFILMQQHFEYLMINYKNNS